MHCGECLGPDLPHLRATPRVEGGLAGRGCVVQPADADLDVAAIRKQPLGCKPPEEGLRLRHAPIEGPHIGCLAQVAQNA